MSCDPKGHRPGPHWLAGLRMWDGGGGTWAFAHSADEAASDFGGDEVDWREMRPDEEFTFWLGRVGEVEAPPGSVVKEHGGAEWHTLTLTAAEWVERETSGPFACADGWDG